MEHFDSKGYYLLFEAISKQRPELLPYIEATAINTLSNRQIDELQGAIADELVSTGLQENDEPNARGTSLESLIDKLNHLRT